MKKQVRLDKFLSEMSGASRSEVKVWLKKGRVSRNGMSEKDPGLKISPEEDCISLDGVPLTGERYHYLMLHKPAGVVSATRDDRERTVLDLIADQKFEEPFGSAIYKDVFPVGRLDKDTEGLLLLTDDGELSHRLLSPRKHVDKCYYAVLDGPISESEIIAFKKGLDIGDEKMTLPAILQSTSHEEDILHHPAGLEGFGVLITIHEGRFHQVKRMAQAIGREVLYLKRLTMASLSLDPTLMAGECRKLTDEEIQSLKETNRNDVSLS